MVIYKTNTDYQLQNTLCTHSLQQFFKPNIASPRGFNKEPLPVNACILFDTRSPAVEAEDFGDQFRGCVSNAKLLIVLYRVIVMFCLVLSEKLSLQALCCLPSRHMGDK